MEWTEEVASGAKVHALTLEDNETVGSVLEEFIRRVLEKAHDPSISGMWRKLAVEIWIKEIPEDSGDLSFKFTNERLSACAGVDTFSLRSEAFTCLDDNQDSDEQERKKLVLLLSHYNMVKRVLSGSAMTELLKQINAIRPLQVFAATNNGWIDLNLGSPKLGDLPENDVRLLKGQKVLPEDIISTLTTGTVTGAGGSGKFELEDG